MAFKLNHYLIYEKNMWLYSLQLDKVLSILFQSSYSLSCVENFFLFVMSCKYEVYLIMRKYELFLLKKVQ